MFQTHSLQKMIRNEELVRKHEASSWTSQAWFNRCSEVSTRSLAGRMASQFRKNPKSEPGQAPISMSFEAKWPKMTCLARINLMNMLNGRCAPPGKKVRKDVACFAHGDLSSSRPTALTLEVPLQLKLNQTPEDRVCSSCGYQRVSFHLSFQ